MIEGLKFHHIGIATRDIDKTAKRYADLGYQWDGKIVFDPVQNVNICFLQNKEMPLIELLAPVDEKSPVVQIIQKNGVTPYHICYATDNIENTINLLRKLRFMMVSVPVKACAMGDRRVAFLYNKDIGLIELVEE